MAMYDRFSDSARHVVALAEVTAFARGVAQVEPEDVLIALAHHHGVAGSVLRAVAADDTLLREGLLQHEPPVPPPADRARPIPLSHVTMQAFALAVREADGFRVPLVGTEHLLLGVLREPTGRATALLVAVRRDPGMIRERILDLVSSPGFVSPEQPSGAPEPVSEPDADVPSAAAAAPADGGFLPADRALLVELIAEVGRLRAEVEELRVALDRSPVGVRGYDELGDRKLA